MTTLNTAGRCTRNPHGLGESILGDPALATSSLQASTDLAGDLTRQFGGARGGSGPCHGPKRSEGLTIVNSDLNSLALGRLAAENPSQYDSQAR